MNRTKNDMPQELRKQMIALLNARLADAIDLQTQTKQAHWNVRGTNFIGLHKLFDEVYEAVEEYIDLIAERVVQLGGLAEGTARIVARVSTLPEYPHDIVKSEDHVEALSTVLAAFGKAVRGGIDTAQEAGDADTADIFTEVSRGIDKYVWFVEANRAV